MPGPTALVTLLAWACWISCAPASALAGSSSKEAITGQLNLYFEEGSGHLVAYLLEASPGPVFHVVNWAQLGRLPPGCASGATVMVTGIRVSQEEMSAPPPTAAARSAIWFKAYAVKVVEPANPRRLRASWAAQGSQRAAAKQGLETLVIRPRLPESCAANRVAPGDAAAWTETLGKVSALQSACTGGRLTYNAPTVADYWDIPCTPLADTSCDAAVWQRWGQDSLAAAAQLGLSPDAFDHVIIDLPPMPGCFWGGMGMIGGSLIYNNGLPSTRFTAHEMGHNYGLSHSAAIELGLGGEVPGGMPVANSEDDSSLMGHLSGEVCFSFPHSKAIGLASAKRVAAKRLPAGKVFSYELKPTWSPGQQGVVITAAVPGFSSKWTIWASYLVSTSGPNPTILSNPLFNQAVLLHLTSPAWGDTVYRIRVLQSGQVFRWGAVGLVFKFGSVTGDGHAATLQVCREAGDRHCALEPTVQLAQSPVQLAALGLVGADWCLAAPAGASSGAYFAGPCLHASSSTWYTGPHASGFTRLVHAATGRCLSVAPDSPLNADTNDVARMKYHLVLADCSTTQPPDFRRDPQLFLPQQQGGGAQGAVSLMSSLSYPGTGYAGVLLSLSLEACDGGQEQCSQGLPAARDGALYTLALAGLTWAPPSQQQQLRLVPA